MHGCGVALEQRVKVSPTVSVIVKTKKKESQSSLGLWDKMSFWIKILCWVSKWQNIHFHGGELFF